MRELISKVVLAFYQPKRSFVRSSVDDLDNSRGREIRIDIATRDGPMSQTGKNKSIDQGKSTDTKGSKILEFNEIPDFIDLKNEHLNNEK